MTKKADTFIGIERGWKIFAQMPGGSLGNLNYNLDGLPIYASSRHPLPFREWLVARWQGGYGLDDSPIQNFNGGFHLYRTQHDAWNDLVAAFPGRERDKYAVRSVLYTHTATVIQPLDEKMIRAGRIYIGNGTVPSVPPTMRQLPPLNYFFAGGQEVIPWPLTPENVEKLRQKDWLVGKNCVAVPRPTMQESYLAFYQGYLLGNVFYDRKNKCYTLADSFEPLASIVNACGPYFDVFSLISQWVECLGYRLPRIIPKLDKVEKVNEVSKQLPILIKQTKVLVREEMARAVDLQAYTSKIDIKFVREENNSYLLVWEKDRYNRLEFRGFAHLDGSIAAIYVCTPKLEVLYPDTPMYQKPYTLQDVIAELVRGGPTLSGREEPK